MEARHERAIQTPPAELLWRSLLLTALPCVFSGLQQSGLLEPECPPEAVPLQAKVIGPVGI